MTYSCSDFTDDILDTLNIKIPDALNDDPRAQAGMAIDEIRRLQALANENNRVVRVLDASTSHLTVAERELLEAGELPGLAYSSEYGGLVSTAPYETSARDDLPDGASATLTAIMQEAFRRGCSYVMFDADATELDDFPTFDDE